MIKVRPIHERRLHGKIHILELAAILYRTLPSQWPDLQVQSDLAAYSLPILPMKRSLQVAA